MNSLFPLLHSPLIRCYHADDRYAYDENLQQGAHAHSTEMPKR